MSPRGFFLSINKFNIIKMLILKILWKYKMQDIIENATIFYKNGSKEIYNAISIMDKGVYTGEIRQINPMEDGFVHQKFIPMDQIEKIIFLNKNGKTIDIDFKRKKIERKKYV
jgi:hypothetical protein